MNPHHHGFYVKPVMMEWTDIMELMPVETWVADGAKVTLLLPQVIPILWRKRYVSYLEILKCRQVCRRLAQVVDSIPGFRTPYSEWTISYEVADSTRFGDWIEEGGWQRQATYHNSYNERYSSWEYSVKYPFPEERLMHGDPGFLPIMNSLQFDPTLTTSLVYHIGLYQLCRLLTQNNSPLQSYSHSDGMHFRNGNNVWTLSYPSVGGVEIVTKFTTGLFLHFPHLKYLKLQFSVCPTTRFSTGVNDAFLAKLDRRISEQLDHLQREEGSRIRLNHLTELVLQGADACFSGNEHFPRVISTLILSAPALEKVEWTSVPDDDNNLYHQAVAEVLGACARIRLMSLEVRYWALLRQPFDELLPAEQPWPLKRLWIRVDDSGGFIPVLHCFLGIVKKFWMSLEELHFESVMSDVCDLWQDELGRICSCHQDLESRRASRYSRLDPILPECDDLRISCVKLQRLEIPHSFTYPDFFRWIMNSCPVVAEVRISDCREAWRGREKRLQKLAYKLWTESAGLSLRVIVFQLGALRDQQFRFSRRRFERRGRGSPDYHMYLRVAGLAFCGYLFLLFCYEMLKQSFK